MTNSTAETDAQVLARVNAKSAHLIHRKANLTRREAPKALATTRERLRKRPPAQPAFRRRAGADHAPELGLWSETLDPVDTKRN